MTTFASIPTAGPVSPRQAPRAGAAVARVHATLEALLLTLLAALLGRTWRHTRAQAIHTVATYAPLPVIHAPLRETVTRFDPPPAPTGTHMGVEHPILYVFGPGPGRGMRARPRPHPPARPRLARAPPALSE